VRPIRLELRGFTAFREQTIVVFEGRELFAITGPTGAGKSSLLDAMTWALFGQVPRVGSSTRQLISHGASSMQVRFDFATRDSTYRVVRKAPAVTGTRLEQLQADGNWRHLADRSRDVTREVTRLLGMDFTTFTRTVLLPQGEFDAFLKGEQSERRAILTKLLGLSVYDDARKIANDRAKQARGRSETVEAQLAKLNLASPERIAEIEVEHATAQQRLCELNERREALRGLGDLARTAREADGAAASAAAAGMAARGAQAAAEQAVVTASETVATAERECDALSRARTQLQYDPKQHQTLLAQIERIKLREAAERALEAAQAERKAAEGAATAANRAVAEAEVAQISTAAAQQQASTQLAEVLGAARLELADLEGRAREALASAEAATRNRVSPNKRLPGLEAASKQLGERSAAHTAAAQAATEASTVQAAAEQQAVAVEATLEAATARISTVRAALEQARHADLATTIRSGLHLGDPCSVCGNPITQLPIGLDESRIGEAEAAVREAEQLIEGARRQATEGRTAAAAATARAESASITLVSATELLGAVNAELAELNTTAEALPGALTQCREQYQQVEERERVATKSSTVVTAELESMRVALAGAPPEVEPTSADAPCGDLAAIGKAIEVWRSARNASTISNGQLQNAVAERSKYEQAIAASAARTEAAGQHLERSRVRLAEHADARSATESSSLREALEVAERASKRAEELDGLIATARATIAARIATHTAAEADRAKAVAAASVGATAAQSTRENAEREQQTLAIAWREAIDDSTPGFDALRGLMLTHEADQQAGAIRAGALGEQIAQAKREIVDAERMRGEVASDRSIAELHSALAKELQGDRFVGYIQREAMQLLAADASYRLDGFTGGRYELAADENEFVVVDRLNGDERRSVKTLSGGETFLASLALALSLSEHLPQLAGLGGAVSLESLFLDEGFGALDTESLDLAVQGLETLAGGHRMIGVISHVEEIAERLPERIEVVKSGNGSTIRG